jgi:carboxyl-terminal processing protease
MAEVTAMPRRNYFVIFCAVVVSLLCYRAADRNPLGRSFAEVADLVERRYVGQVDRDTLWAGAVRGMLGELGDPYSVYIDPKEAAEFEEALSQEFAGIGVQLDPRSNWLTVLSPIVGSPAYRAGIMAGDVIVKIDGQSARSMKYADASRRIRGKPGEKVQLTLERPGKTEPIEFSIPREVVNVDSVLGDTRDEHDQWNFLIQKNPNIGYVRIVNFGEHTAEELKAALEKLKAENVQGLVLDLRFNPGGLLKAARSVCNLLIAEGKPIVSTRGRDHQVLEKYAAEGGEKFLDFPMAVLVNDSSASAAEIVAACLQDNGRAVVVGQRSYGKGTVQNVIPLNDHLGVLKLTTADFWRPSDHNIQRRHEAQDADEWGVSPDKGLEVKTSEPDAQKWMLWRRDRDVVHPHTADAVAGTSGNSNDAESAVDHDAPLRRAMQYLEGQIEKTRAK